jgi:hypothetical protein
LAGLVCPSGDIRLVGGSVADEGRVELCLSNSWGTICDDGFDENDANVICRQLGYPDHGDNFQKIFIIFIYRYTLQMPHQDFQLTLDRELVQF